MRKIGFILSAFFFLTAFKAGTHEFYLSVTEIEYKAEKQSLQIITRVFTDDFENVLRERFNDDIRLVEDNEDGPVKEMIEKYLSQKLALKAGSKNLDLNYLGKEYESDQVVLYIEAENVKPFKQIEVTNTILTDLFDDQKNVVHVTVNGKTKSLLLHKSADKEQLSFER